MVPVQPGLSPYRMASRLSAPLSAASQRPSFIAFSPAEIMACWACNWVSCWTRAGSAIQRCPGCGFHTRCQRLHVAIHTVGLAAPARFERGLERGGLQRLLLLELLDRGLQFFVGHGFVVSSELGPT